jgi:hypothetical protein
MRTDGIECLERMCPFNNDLFEFSCCKGENEPVIDRCVEFFDYPKTIEDCLRIWRRRNTK